MQKEEKDKAFQAKVRKSLWTLSSRLLTVFPIFTWLTLADFGLLDAFLFHKIFFPDIDNRCFASDDKHDKL